MIYCWVFVESQAEADQRNRLARNTSDEITEHYKVGTTFLKLGYQPTEIHCEFRMNEKLIPWLYYVWLLSSEETEWFWEPIVGEV